MMRAVARAQASGTGGEGRGRALAVRHSGGIKSVAAGEALLKKRYAVHKKTMPIDRKTLAYFGKCGTMRTVAARLILCIKV